MNVVCTHSFHMVFYVLHLLLCYREFILSSKREVLYKRVAFLGDGEYSAAGMSSQIKGFE